MLMLVQSLLMDITSIAYRICILDLIGFLPKDTAQHHRAHVLSVLRQALDEAKIKPDDVDVICYTKGILKYLFPFNDLLII